MNDFSNIGTPDRCLAFVTLKGKIGKGRGRQGSTIKRLRSCTCAHLVREINQFPVGCKKEIVSVNFNEQVFHIDSIFLCVQHQTLVLFLFKFAIILHDYFKQRAKFCIVR